MKRVVVIGGGISGLAAAHRLWELNREKRLNLSVTLLEGSPRLGGLIETLHREKFLLEGGPDAFMADKPGGMELCRRIGMEDELVQTREHPRRSFILQGEKLVPVPKGFYLIAPARLNALLQCPLLSWKGKLRMALEPFIPPARGEKDESVAHFVRRRYGKEALERIAQPMIGGIYAADVEKLSARAAIPQFCEMERRFGSVSRALGRGAAGIAAGAQSASGPRYGLFVTPKSGMVRLVEVVTRRMLQVELKTSTPVSGLSRSGGGWTVRAGQGQLFQAEAVCVALPAPHAAALLRSAAPELAAELSEIPYGSAATVNIGLKRQDIAVPPDGFGFVVPAPGGDGMIGCTFSSVKFPERAPEDSLLLRAFVAGPAAEGREWELEQLVLERLRKLLGLKEAPRFVLVRRYPKSMPQYPVGHLERVAQIEQKAAAIPGLFLTGNGYRGLGIPDCIRQAESASEKIAAEATNGRPAR